MAGHGVSGCGRQRRSGGADEDNANCKSADGEFHGYMPFWSWIDRGTLSPMYTQILVHFRPQVQFFQIYT
jgi:hypothetical protein